MSQGVDFNIVIPIRKSLIKIHIFFFCIKIGLDKSLQSGEIWFQNTTPVLIKEHLNLWLLSKDNFLLQHVLCCTHAMCCFPKGKTNIFQDQVKVRKFCWKLEKFLVLVKVSKKSRDLKQMQLLQRLEQVNLTGFVGQVKCHAFKIPLKTYITWRSKMKRRLSVVCKRSWQKLLEKVDLDLIIHWIQNCFEVSKKSSCSFLGYNKWQSWGKYRGHLKITIN